MWIAVCENDSCPWKHRGPTWPATYGAASEHAKETRHGVVIDRDGEQVARILRGAEDPAIEEIFEDGGMSKHPHRAEAVRIVRERHDDRLADLPDEAVAKLMQTQHVEFGLALKACGHAIRDALPERLRRMLGG